MRQNNAAQRFPTLSGLYTKSLFLICAILSIGIVLQLLTGPFDVTWLKFPVNLGIGCCLLLIPLLTKDKNKLLSGLPLSVILLSAMAVLVLIMGISSQEKTTDNPGILQDFLPVTRCWPFVWLYFLLLVHLAYVIVYKIRSFKRYKTGFLCTHAGLWLLLFCAGPGAADKERYRMQIRENDTENLGINEKGQWIALPLHIRLTDFKMEEYPPKIAILNRYTQQFQPDARPHFLDAADSTGTLKAGDWKIEARHLLSRAEKGTDSLFKETNSSFSVPAVRITATHKNKNIKSGWISSGNYYQLPQTLPLTDTLAVIMLPPEPKLFLSELQITHRDGKNETGITRVNHPFSCGHWKIYQAGYNARLGKNSDYSVLELVYDPWLIPANIGIILLMIGCVSLFWQGNNRSKTKNDPSTLSNL